MIPFVSVGEWECFVNVIWVGIPKNTASNTQGKQIGT